MPQLSAAFRTQQFNVSLSKEGQTFSEERSDNFRPNTPTILLVDDDAAVRGGLRSVLTAEGWQVICAATGEEALESLAEQQPDLMITDLCLPEVSGWDLLFHESIQRPYLPIFVITGLPPRDTGGADRFAAMFFPKPVDLDELVTAIRRCLGVTRFTQIQR